MAPDGIEVVVIIRSHEGGFCYESADIQTIIRDIQVNIDDAALVILRTLVGLEELDLTYRRITDEPSEKLTV